MECFDWQPSMDLETWIRNNNMTDDEIGERISYLKMELLHSGFHDGWSSVSMKKELKKLLEKN
jgi:hypothetical protein